jgi:PAS domain-containing protein
MTVIAASRQAVACPPFFLSAAWPHYEYNGEQSQLVAYERVDKSMPRQNRVTPFGEIVAVPDRGTWMGNRGRLHDDQGRIRKAWQVDRWLLCLLEFHGRHRTVMALNRYTELFFLDEATGLAAGHRPCFECRRKSFNSFREAWTTGNPQLAGAGSSIASMIDHQLHRERLALDRSKQTFRARLENLPDGVFVTDGAERENRAYLLWNRQLLTWTPGGYRERQDTTYCEEVLVLTPRSTVGAIRAGYEPEVHRSAQGL